MTYVLPFMILMKEILFALDLQRYIPNVLGGFLSNTPTVHKVNHGVVALSVVLQMQPHTKHIPTKYHHFRSFVMKFDVVIKHINTKE